MPLIPAFEVGIWNAWMFMILPWIDTFVLRLFKKEIYQKASALTSEMKTSNRYKTISYISMIVEFLAIIYSIFLPLKLGTAWFYISLAIFLLGLLVLVIASVSFASTPVDDPVTKGIYRYSRHPLYLAISLIYLSVSIASASWIFLLFWLMQIVSVSMAASDEEGYCLKKYGDGYREYINRTPRWLGLPRI